MQEKNNSTIYIYNELIYLGKDITYCSFYMSLHSKQNGDSIKKSHFLHSMAKLIACSDFLYYNEVFLIVCFLEELI